MGEFDPHPSRAPSEQPPTRFTICHWFLLAQVVLAAALIFLPFGFDHRTHLGLDFEDMTFLGFCYFVAFIGSIATAIRRAQWECLVISGVVTLAGGFLFIIMQD